MTDAGHALTAQDERTLPPRLASLDAYRGIVMLLLLGECLHLRRVAAALPGNGFWAFLAHHQSHVAWVGCSLHDMIQPSFSFLVGAVLPFSLARRRDAGQSTLRTGLHVLWRAAVLIGLGIFLRSLGHARTYFTFEDTLTQIGLGYVALYWVARRGPRVFWASLVGILVGYWLAFALYPLPGAAFDWGAAGVSADWPGHLRGFAAHWNKNTNAAWAFDRWFLNLFPRSEPFTHNGGGYSTLSFVPTLATMVLGLGAGRVLRAPGSAGRRVRLLAGWGLACLAAGWGLGALGLCPVVKRIWTPAWVLFSGGLCLLLTAVLYGLIDVLGWRRWAFGLRVVGMNAITAYLMEWFAVGFVAAALRRHLGDGVFGLAGEAYRSLLEGGAVLLVLWGVLFWMYRKRLFLRI